MLLNFLKIFLRQTLKHRVFSLINIIGLSVALTACLLISNFVIHELSYDRQYANADYLYQIASRFKSADQRSETVSTPAVLAPTLKENFPEIEEVGRLALMEGMLAREELRFKEQKLGFADNSMFTLFDWQWLMGNPQTALLDVNSIVLTQSLAKKYFGDQSPLGETLNLENKTALVVTGVIADLPSNTHFDFSALVSLQQLETVLPGLNVLDSWNVSFGTSYFLLRSGAQAADIQTQLPALLERYSPLPADVQASRELIIKKVTSAHLHPELDDKAGGNFTTVLVFACTALCILLIAVVNFVNLAVSRYAARAREAGVRKSVGADRFQLILQFTGEAVLLACSSMLVALAGAELLTPLLEGLTGSPIASMFLSNPLSAFAAFGLALVLGLVAGLYPAYCVASIKPGAALSGSLSSGKSGLHLRNGLVLFQFASAICIIVITLVIHLQMRYINKMDTGYQAEHLVVLSVPPGWNENYASFWEPFKEQMLAEPGIVGVTHSMGDFLGIGGFITRFRAADEAEARRVPVMSVGHDFFSVYQVDFLSGRDFSEAVPADAFYPRDSANAAASLSGSFILNEMAAHEFGWTAEDAVGQALYYGSSGVAGTVIGVVRNTLSSSRDLQRPIIYYTPLNGRYPVGGKISLSLSGRNLQQTLNHIDSTWSTFFPEEPVSRVFLQDQISALYLNEERQARLFRYFALLSITLACMGLFGLAAFNAQLRTKEIGVRKVMGGSVWSIVVLLTNDFSRLVLLSNVIAWPLAYVAMERWLENFAYRIDLTPLIFIGGGLIALCIAWVTVGGTAAKAASQKPVLALRYE